MSRKHTDTDSAVDGLKNESARQRWELFHRAIAHAKQSNDAQLQEAETHSGDDERGGPVLLIVR